jgi:hypothetical protein
MSGWPDQPVIYEINTATWLGELSREAGRQVTLAGIDDSAWDAVTPTGIDAVWLMGVWQRSPAGLAMANSNEELRASFRGALPDLRAEDIIGSPYCVRQYVVDERFGGRSGLAAARTALAARGVRLILDYVPNHVAPDHPWVSSHPEFFIQGDEDDVKADPAAWLTVDGHVLAHGRDPYFPPWPDVVQLNAFSPAARAATELTLADIADQYDGIRCDMAMLMTNEVFAKTWRDRAGAEPTEEFWSAVIAELHARHPDSVVIAEAYWDMEWTLQEQGFDFCYDKRLCDRILAADADLVRDHLRAGIGYQSRLIRFLENHDEPRVADRLPKVLRRAAAVAVATLPGATMWHQGQFEGRRVRVPVFLARLPSEPPEPGLADWYRRLVSTVAEDQIRRGTWCLLEPSGWPDNQSCHNLLAWSWTADDGVGRGRHVIVVNLSEAPAQGRIPLPWTDLPGRNWRLADLFDDGEFVRDGSELAEQGLFVAMGPGQSYVLAVRAETT